VNSRTSLYLLIVFTVAAVILGAFALAGGIQP